MAWPHPSSPTAWPWPLLRDLTGLWVSMMLVRTRTGNREKRSREAESPPLQEVHTLTDSKITLANASLVQFKVRRGRIRTGPSFILTWPWPFSDPSVQGWVRVGRKVHPAYSGSAGVRTLRTAPGLHVSPSWMWPSLPLPPRLTRAVWSSPGLW